VEQTVAEKVCTIRAKVADLVGNNRYRTWFGGATDFQLEGEQLDVTVANAFIGSWITANYMPHLIEATRDVIGAEPHVRVRVGEDGNGHVPYAAPVQADQRACCVPTEPRATSTLRQTSQPRTRAKLRGQLDTFVVGPSNELAYSVTAAVSHAPGEAFKHLILHGGCGLGKTHLLQGLCNALSRTHPELAWCYLSGEEFTNEFIYAVKAGRIDRFRARFRNVDVLVIDDIHFLANKKATQGEFLHTFNAIDASGKTVVLSSDRHPRSIATLSEPLINRLIAAMVIQIDPPNLATRQEILRRRAAKMSCKLPDEVLDYVARHIVRNVRELEGALYKLVALASLTKERINLDLARRTVEDYVSNVQPPEATEIERIVATHFGVTREALRSSSRDRAVTHARGFAMYLIRKHTRLSSPEIGRLLGKRKHSTVLMASQRIQKLIDQDGVVTWKTPSGMCEVPARKLLEDIEQRLLRRRDTS